eukprot:3310905-Amphidinium_carterae.1
MHKPQVTSVPITVPSTAFRHMQVSICVCMHGKGLRADNFSRWLSRALAPRAWQLGSSSPPCGEGETDASRDVRVHASICTRRAAWDVRFFMALDPA